MTLEELLPIIQTPGIEFVSLQYGDVKQEIESFNQKHGVRVLECQSIDNLKDIDGHAALIDACDFVVTVSNTSAHIAGAIGKKTYLLYPKGTGALWYWSNQKLGQSIWYPSVKVCQQLEFGQWDEIINKVAEKLK